MKWKKISFIAIRLLFLKKDVDVEKVLVSKNIFLDEKNYKYFICYSHNDHKVKPLHTYKKVTTITHKFFKKSVNILRKR